MSTSLAIAAVTHLLAEQVEAALPEFPAGGKLVTVGPPQLMREGRKDPQVNLFLYQVAPDAAWRNQDAPNRTKPGERAYPLLALKLQYLVTAFGKDDDDKQAHPMLGGVMLKLHNEPILPKTGKAKEIADSGLAEQYEPVRLTFQPLTVDEAAKLWSGFQSDYRLSVAYEASVVLIDSGRGTQSAPPVLSRGGMDDPGFEALPLDVEPTIESIKPPFGLPGPRLSLATPTKWISDELVLVGKNLDHPDLRLIFRHPRLSRGYISKVTSPLKQTADRLRFRLPHGLQVFEEDSTKSLKEIEAGVPVNPSTDNWPAGVYTVAAARAIRTKPGDSQPPELDRLYSTSPLAFGLLPEIRVPLTSPANSLQFRKAPGGEISAATLTANLQSRVKLVASKIDQSVKLFVGPIELVGTVSSTNGLAITWTATDPVKTAKLVTDLPESGRFLRIQVDGVDSSLLAPPANEDSLPPRKFDNNLLVDVIGL
jgi:hypothetical protein